MQSVQGFCLFDLMKHYLRLPHWSHMALGLQITVTLTPEARFHVQSVVRAIRNKDDFKKNNIKV